MRRRESPAQALGRLAARDARKVEVQDDHVRHLTGGDLECDEAVGSGDDVVSARPEVDPPHVEGIVVVVDQQDSGVRHEPHDSGLVARAAPFIGPEERLP